MSAGAAAQSESERARALAEEHRRKADYLERRAMTFEQGGVGEVQVAETLSRLLLAGYAIVDDIRWPGTSKANIDHVIYGPTGMFVVDAKNWTGKVYVKSGVLRQNGYSRTRETDKVAQMTDAIAAHLGPSVGTPTPVLCLAGQADVDAAWCGRTLVVGLDRLAPWIFRRPEIWPSSHVEALTAWLPHVLQPAASGQTMSVRSRGPASAEVRKEDPHRGRHEAPVKGLYEGLRR